MIGFCSSTLMGSRKAIAIKATLGLYFAMKSFTARF